jgi:hypothetical protein
MMSAHYAKYALAYGPSTRHDGQGHERCDMYFYDAHACDRFPNSLARTISPLGDVVWVREGVGKSHRNYVITHQEAFESLRPTQWSLGRVTGIDLRGLCPEFVGFDHSDDARAKAHADERERQWERQRELQHDDKVRLSELHHTAQPPKVRRWFGR